MPDWPSKKQLPEKNPRLPLAQQDGAYYEESIEYEFDGTGKARPVTRGRYVTPLSPEQIKDDHRCPDHPNCWVIRRPIFDCPPTPAQPYPHTEWRDEHLSTVELSSQALLCRPLCTCYKHAITGVSGTNVALANRHASEVPDD